MTCAKLFSGANQALCYAKHRPAYPTELYSNILDFAGGARSLAVDVACGSGQATTALAGSQMAGVSRTSSWKNSNFRYLK
jgi:hypothetical protein